MSFNPKITLYKMYLSGIYHHGVNMS